MNEIFDRDELEIIAKRTADRWGPGHGSEKFNRSVVSLVATVRTYENRIRELEKLRGGVLDLIMSESEKRLFEIFKREKS